MNSKRAQTRLGSQSKGSQSDTLKMLFAIISPRHSIICRNQQTETALLSVREFPRSIVDDDFLALAVSSKRVTQFGVGRLVHPDEKPAGFSILPRPCLDFRVDLLPAAKVKIANAKISAL